jgi:hypothetical protein
MASTYKTGPSTALNMRAKVCTFDFVFATAADGTATMTAADSYGVVSIVHGVAGIYTITLNKKIASLLFSDIKNDVSILHSNHWTLTSTTTTGGKTVVVFTYYVADTSANCASSTVRGFIRARL